MTALEQQIKALIIDSLGLEDMDVDDIDSMAPLFGDDGLGLDSVDALELGLAVQKAFGFTLDNDSASVRSYFYSVQTLAQFVASQQSAQR
ncbi:phosphopantetheine-binding protein [Snodgrassella sp. CFCC 13594]|uniref:phosphopantetheine-binding protein n=1 Tax=Snodgrassella sp. CFCC 13594 TaxID=1775559 RepID=UPI0008350DFD|nr:phosphopantetheine-binding protein [Snodgrassella sp. CFCC 13594]